MLASLRRLLGGLSSVLRRGRDSTAKSVDLSSPEAVRDPSPQYAALRRAGSVHFLPEHGFWLVLDYAGVAYALKHPQVFSSARPTVRFDPILNETDPPAHTRVRRVLAPLFSAHSVQALEDHARACAASLLAGGGGTAEIDLVDEFAVPLTERVVGRLLGLSPEETEALRQRLDPHRHGSDQELYHALEDWMRAYVEELRGSPDPGDGFGSRLLRGEGEAALTPEEITGLLKLLWVAGTTTTGKLIASSALLLMQHPRIREELQADPRLLPAFVEEAARLEPPEQMAWRATRESVELSGTRIPAGAEVRLSILAANRDPEHFADPDGISLRRNPNPHLSFGAGPHYCPGARLGRMQVRVALETLLSEWPGFRAARPLSTVAYEGNVYFRVLKHLYVTPA